MKDTAKTLLFGILGLVTLPVWLPLVVIYVYGLSTREFIDQTKRKNKC